MALLPPGDCSHEMSFLVDEARYLPLCIAAVPQWDHRTRTQREYREGGQGGSAVAIQISQTGRTDVIYLSLSIYLLDEREGDLFSFACNKTTQDVFSWCGRATCCSACPSRVSSIAQCCSS